MNKGTMQTWILISVMLACCRDYVNSSTVVAETSSINIQEGFPEELHVSLYIDDNRPLHMRLKRSITLDSNVPLFVICNGSLIEKNGTSDLAAQFYQDIDTGAAIELSCDNSTEECIPSLRGSFYQDKILYELSPFVENDTLAISHIKKRSADSHRVVQRTDQDGNEISKAPMRARYSIQVRKMSQRSKRSYKEPRCVELVAVISYDIFKRWYELSPHFDKTARENDALFNIRRYFAMVVQGVDLRYSSIITIDFSLCVKLSAYVIATTKRDSPWTETRNVAGIVDGADVLPFFRTWSIHNGGKIGPYDHIQLFTGYDVKTGLDRSAVGLSYISSICLKSWAVSIVEDNQDMMHTTTASTHEIGHSLGAYHDGHRNICPKSSKYIMSPKIGQPSSADELNPWRFSQCSVSYFAQTLRLLKRYGIDCIIDKPRLLDDRQWKSYTRNLPGQLYPPDQQCRLMHGDTSFMSRKLLQERALQNVCTGMWCHSGGSKFTFHIPARGTSCGNRKWCIDGKCQANATAPTMNEQCPFGDFVTDIFVGWTCKRLVQHWDYLCTWDYQGMKKKCCDSCAPVLRKSRGKRSLLRPPSDEEIKRELNRRALLRERRSRSIGQTSLDQSSLVHLQLTETRRKRRISSLTGLLRSSNNLSTSGQLDRLLFNNLPMAA